MAAQFPRREHTGTPPRRQAGASAAPRRRADEAPERRREPSAARRDPETRRAADAPRDTSWEGAAAWYDTHQGEKGDDFYSVLILPAVERLLGSKRGHHVLDVACGQGVLGRHLAKQGVRTTGVDASPTLLAKASERAGALETYVTGDARQLDQSLAGQRFDAAALVLALQDLDPIAPVLAGVSAHLKPGARVVMVMTHPCFRIPRRAGWAYDETDGVQYRRIGGYLSPSAAPVRIHPGMPADTGSTTTFHRPLSVYLNACGAAGLGVVACEELCSHRRGTKGPRYGAEDLAMKEIPLFIALAAVRL